MLVGLHVPTNFLIYRQTLTLSKCMCRRASGASEFRKIWHFYILNLLFLSIFCRYIRYFVGTNDMLVGSHVPTNFQMYRQKSEKALWGGSCPPLPPPPPPPLATLMPLSLLHNIFAPNIINQCCQWHFISSNSPQYWASHLHNDLLC